MTTLSMPPLPRRRSWYRRPSMRTITVIGVMGTIGTIVVSILVAIGVHLDHETAQTDENRRHEYAVEQFAAFEEQVSAFSQRIIHQLTSVGDILVFRANERCPCTAPSPSVTARPGGSSSCPPLPASGNTPPRDDAESIALHSLLKPPKGLKVLNNGEETQSQKRGTRVNRVSGRPSSSM